MVRYGLEDVNGWDRVSSLVFERTPLLVRWVSLVQVLSQVVVWDKIIEKREDAKLKLRGEFMDYPLRDPALELRYVKYTMP